MRTENKKDLLIDKELDQSIWRSVFPMSIDTHNGKIESFGLTKRELFAAMAMQGVLANSERVGGRDLEYAEYSVKLADALIEKLNNESK